MSDTQQCEWDVIVVGYGGAGASAAITAAKEGARVLLVEKAPRLGGLTILCSGRVRIADDAAAAAQYLERTNGGRVDSSLAHAMAEGLTQIPAFFHELAEPFGAEVYVSLGEQQSRFELSDLYDWPGREALGWAGIDDIPGFEGYPWVHEPTRGQTLMRLLDLNVQAVGVEVWFASPAVRLLREGREVVGVAVERDGELVEARAHGGVVLASGGFEFAAQLLADHSELPSIDPLGHPYNTGDGVRMAQEAGSAIWHMWHFHGSYGVRIPGHPVALANVLPGGPRREHRKAQWILVDQAGKRFTNEWHRAVQDTGWRPLTHLDSESGDYDRVPCWMVFDEPARLLGPVARQVAVSIDPFYKWSADNSREVEQGWILKADTVAGLAAQMGVPVAALRETVATWNASVDGGEDPAFGRPSGTFMPVAQPPFYALQAWPVVSNTHGGPKRDALQRALDPFDQPIAGLYTAGELGSFYGHVYMLGGHLSEAIVGGRIAGRHAARRAADRTGAVR
jgi:succinate dehydrogenase/fumarate reductase flavoprotein subunit